jgi:hypothetical protein
MYFPKLRRGKYKGKTFPEVLLTDPDWFFWVQKNGKFGSLQKNERTSLYVRAISIKIPDVKGIPAKAMYILKPGTKLLVEVKIVPKEDNSVNSPDAFFSDALNLEIPSQFGVNSKYYSNPVLALVKRIYFGSSSAQLTKEQCEEFFANGLNFFLTTVYDDE